MRKILVVLLLICSVLFAGCDQGNNVKTEAPKTTTTTSQTQKQTKVEVTVYRAASDGSNRLLAEKVSMPANGKSKAENALLALLTVKPQKAIYADVIPNGTKLLSFKVDKGLATVNFSKELAKKRGGSYEEMMSVYSIVNTLTEYPEIKKVQFLIEGKKVITLSGHMDIEDPIKRNKTLLPKN